MKCKHCKSELVKIGKNRNGVRLHCPNKRCPVILARKHRDGRVDWHLEAQAVAM